MTTPTVSVIVPVRNNAEGIAALLEHLDAQTLPLTDFEVVIGDDGSEPPLDGVRDDGRIRIVRGAPRTSYAARNDAVAAARGAVLAFCDSDCLPEPAWLEAGLAALGEADIAAGEVRFLSPSRTTVWSLLTMDMYLDQERNVRHSRAVTCNLFVRRQVFEGVGGFDESLPSGGDYDFTRRATAAGARLVFAPAAIVGHPTLDRRRAFLRKLWLTNRTAALRRARVTPGIDLGAVAMFVPVAGPALARHDHPRPLLRLSSRAHVQGRPPGLRRELQVLSLVYLVLGFVSGAARIAGWRAGRKAAG